MGGFLKLGAGSIRAYPHAENTGLIISDVAKLSKTSKFWSREIKKKSTFHTLTLLTLPSLRLAEELDDMPYGLGREELGVAALVAAGEGGYEGRTALNPLR